MTTAPIHVELLRVDPRLDQDAQFTQLLQLAEQDYSSDVLGTQSPEQRARHWLAILARADGFESANTDGRLELLRYRAELNLHGIDAALQRMARWGNVLAERTDDTAPSDEAGLDTAFRVACYFFSDAHLADLRRARLHATLESDAASIFKLAHNAPGGRPDAALQRLRTELAAWAPGQRDLVARFNAGREFFGHLEAWLHAHNRLGFEIRAEPVRRWFTMMEDIVLQHGAPKVAEPVKPIAASMILPQDLPAGEAGCTTSNVRSLSFDTLQREDVHFLLQAICRWYQVHEPSSPVPYFLQRAARTMHADFLSILQDLLPDSTPQFEKLAGVSVKK
jgi:type VI secretion system protein ImpA